VCYFVCDVAFQVTFAGKCDTGWLQFTANCYKFRQEYLSWHEAKKDCEEENSHLVVIHTKEENAFITSQVLYSRAIVR